MVRNHEGRGELDSWRASFLAVMGCKSRRTSKMPHFRRLHRPGDRERLQPTAARMGFSGHDQLRHVPASLAWHVPASATWYDALPRRNRTRQADRLVDGRDACLALDDKVVPKKYTFLAGVARRDRGAHGNLANFQSRVSPTLAQGEVPVPWACPRSRKRQGRVIRGDACGPACLSPQPNHAVGGDRALAARSPKGGGLMVRSGAGRYGLRCRRRLPGPPGCARCALGGGPHPEPEGRGGRHAAPAARRLCS